MVILADYLSCRLTHPRGAAKKQEQWDENETKEVLLRQNAFGMGIDKQMFDLWCIWIYLKTPKEAYFQESGDRGGRDEKKLTSSIVD